MQGPCDAKRHMGTKWGSSAPATWTRVPDHLVATRERSSSGQVPVDAVPTEQKFWASHAWGAWIPPGFCWRLPVPPIAI